MKLMKVSATKHQLSTRYLLMETNIQFKIQDNTYTIVFYNTGQVPPVLYIIGNRVNGPERQIVIYSE